MSGRSATTWGLACVLLVGMHAGCAAGTSTTQQEDTASAGKWTLATQYPEGALLELLTTDGQALSCTGTVIAPRLLLTAGHCVDGVASITVTLPYLAIEPITTTTLRAFDWTDGETFNRNHHDIGLVYLPTPVVLDTYPTLARAPVADGTLVTNVTRVDATGTPNSDELFASPPTGVRRGTSDGYPFSYFAIEAIQQGDSGGGVFLTGSHVLVAVNSAISDKKQRETLARVDLLYDWIAATAHEWSAGSVP